MHRLMNLLRRLFPAFDATDRVALVRWTISRPTVQR